MLLVYHLLADITVVLHFAYVAFVICGWLAIAIGGLCGWQWVRNRAFRGLHLSMIAIVVTEAWLGITCPLTTWEQQLRTAAGDGTYRGAFLANAVHDLLFYDLRPEMFATLYTTFGALVLFTFWLVPVNWRSRMRAVNCHIGPNSDSSQLYRVSRTKFRQLSVWLKIDRLS